MIIWESEVNMEQYNDNKRKNNKYITKRLDSKSDIKRKYKLIIEEEYIYDIERIINSYVNYT